MFSRAFASAKQQYDASRAFVKTATEVIDEHKSLIWVAGTASSALAGWAVYTSRRLHYSKIEDAMSEIRKKISEKEQHKIPHPQSVSMALVVAPAVSSAFLVGYLCGRTRGSYIRARTLQVRDRLSEDRVYVAILPAHAFDAATVGRRVEAAIAEAETEMVQQQSKTWRDWRPWSRATPKRLTAPPAIHFPQHQQQPHQHRQIQPQVQAALLDQQQQQQQQQQKAQQQQQKAQTRRQVQPSSNREVEAEKHLAVAAAAASTVATTAVTPTTKGNNSVSAPCTSSASSTSSASKSRQQAVVDDHDVGGLPSGSTSPLASPLKLHDTESEEGSAVLRPLVCANAPSTGCIAAPPAASCASTPVRVVPILSGHSNQP